MLAVRNTPLVLTATRLFLGPVVLAVAIYAPNARVFAACLVAALMSDYFDGVIARKLGVATPNLRRFDSIADSIFYISALVAAYYLYPDLLRPYIPAVSCLAVLEVARYAFDYKKFGKEASYHMWSSKIWGLTLFWAFFVVLVLGNAGWPVSIAIFVGIVADLEGLAISATLKTWKTDVPTIIHARRIARADA